MVELLVVIGVVAILVALALPAVGGAADRARKTGRLQVLKSNVSLLGLYCLDHKDVYPVARDTVNTASYEWYDALIPGGYIKSPSEVDPDFPKYGHSKFVLSFCMVMDPRLMRRGHTIPIQGAPTSAVTQGAVAFPNRKGMMHELFQWPRPAWCCVPRVFGPVAFADGSAELTTWLDLCPSGRVYVENVIGYPVLSTWEGCLGADR